MCKRWDQDKALRSLSVSWPHATKAHRLQVGPENGKGTCTVLYSQTNVMKGDEHLWIKLFILEECRRQTEWILGKKELTVHSH